MDAADAGTVTPMPSAIDMTRDVDRFIRDEFGVEVTHVEMAALIEACGHTTTVPRDLEMPSPVGGVSLSGDPLPDRHPPIIGLTGLPGAGKDHVASLIAWRYQGVSVIRYSDPIIDAANRMLAEAGSGNTVDDSTKHDPVFRLLLQTLAMVGRRSDESMWDDRVYSQVAVNGASLTVITGIRTMQEVALLRERGGQLWRVRAAGAVTSATNGHELEETMAALHDSRFDRVILNDRTAGPDVLAGNIHDALS